MTECEQQLVDDCELIANAFRDRDALQYQSAELTAMLVIALASAAGSGFRLLRGRRMKRDVQLVERYCAENGDRCELGHYFPGVVGRGDVAHTHHIWGGPRRYDVWSNLLCLSINAHDFCHNQPIIGRVLCCMVKSLKDELDVKELDAVIGMSVAGWLQQDKVADRCREWSQQVEAMRLELIHKLGD